MNVGTDSIAQVSESVVKLLPFFDRENRREHFSFWHAGIVDSFPREMVECLAGSGHAHFLVKAS